MPTSAVVDRLVSSHRQFLSFLEKRVESRAVAEDILQSAFVRALEHGSELRNEESAVAWFYRLLRNAAIDYYRHRASTGRAYDGFSKQTLTEQAPDVELRQEICQCIAPLVDGLKPEYRDAIRIVDLEDGSLKDLAARAETTPNNAAVRMHRAREALRKQVRTACGTCAEHGCLDCDCKPRR